MFTVLLQSVFAAVSLVQFTAASSCFQALLNKTQSCDNHNILYVTTQGVGSGLGSEFNYYFIYSLISAMVSERRMVFVISNRHWEYDCPHRHGWACYLHFPCHDSVINASMIDLSNMKNGFHEKDQLPREPPVIRNKIAEAYHELFGADSSCDIDKANPTIMTAIAGRHLYQLNDHTLQFTRSFNARYGLDNSKYLSLQLRLDDKKYEMSAQCWAWMTNMSNVYNLLKPYFESYQHIFISTDNCTTVSELTAMVPSTVQISSPCITNPTDSSNTLYKDLTGSINPRKPGDFKITLRLFADIEMLAHGDYFFGFLGSNLVRMIHRIRYPQLDKTIALAKELTDVDMRTRFEGLTCGGGQIENSKMAGLSVVSSEETLHDLNLKLVSATSSTSVVLGSSAVVR